MLSSQELEYIRILLQFFFNSYMIAWRVKKIIYCFSIPLQSCHWFGSLIQLQVDLILPSLPSQLSHPLLRKQIFVFLWYDKHPVQHRWYGAPLAWSLLLQHRQCPDAVLYLPIWALVWCVKLLADILFTKSTNCSNFYTAWRCYCRSCKNSLLPTEIYC